MIITKRTCKPSLSILKQELSEVAHLHHFLGKAKHSRFLPQVICVDNFFTGSRENVKHLLNKSNFEIIRHDVVEKLLLEVDQIYHLACPASPVHYK